MSANEMKFERMPEVPNRTVQVIDAEVTEVGKPAPMRMETQGQDISLDRAMTTMKETYGDQTIDVEDVVNLHMAHPEEDRDEETPVDARALQMAALMIKHGQDDKESFQIAMAAALKTLRLKGDLKKYDQRAAGRSSDALAAIAGRRHGYRPARFLFRLKFQTKWERWVSTFGHNDQVTNWTKRFRPGPKIGIQDISYWMVVRNHWHCLRPVNGILQASIHTEIPTDCKPEDTMGDDWKVFEGLPQCRVCESGHQVIRNDADLLFVSLGYRQPGWFGRSKSLLTAEWLNHATASKNSKAKRPEDEDKKDDDKKEGVLSGLWSILKIFLAFVIVIASAIVIASLLGF